MDEAGKDSFLRLRCGECGHDKLLSLPCLAEIDADGEQAPTLRPLRAPAVAYRIAFWPRTGQKVLTLRGAMLSEDRACQPLCADIDRFGLHAAV